MRTFTDRTILWDGTQVQKIELLHTEVGLVELH